MSFLELLSEDLETAERKYNECRFWAWLWAVFCGVSLVDAIFTGSVAMFALAIGASYCLVREVRWGQRERRIVSSCRSLIETWVGKEGRR